MLDRYSIKGLLSEGAQSSAFYAFDRYAGRKCILKIGSTAKQEALLAAELGHPYLPIPWNAGVDPDKGCWAAFAEASGKPLHEFWSDASDIEQRRVVFQIVEFLSFLHSRQWLYNDFKPHHFLADQRAVTVIDLGLCSKLDPHKKQSGSGFFSGTFPYISPERLAGRPYDQRSDVFALGMMLLDLFSPFAKNVSLHAFQWQILTRPLSRLNSFWRTLIGDMLAWEPDQRPESAEIWKKILPGRHQKSSLFFPVSTDINLPVHQDSVILVHSPSRLILDEAEHYILRQCWMGNQSVVEIDFAQDTFESFLRVLSRSFGESESSDFFVCTLIVQRNTVTSPLTFLFRNPERLHTEKIALLSYLISLLSKQNFVRVYFLCSQHRSDLIGDNWKIIHPAPLPGSSVGTLVSRLFPPGAENLPGRLRRIRLRFPEDIIRELQEEWKSVPRDWWPSAAWQYRKVAPYERLPVKEKRILAAIALYGGSAPKKVLARIVQSQAPDTVLEKLQVAGHVWIRIDTVFLTTSARRILKRYRKAQLREIAESLLTHSMQTNEFRVSYRAAMILNRRKLASRIAIECSAQASTRGDAGLYADWLWKGYRAGAKLTMTQACSVIRHSLRRMQIKRARAMLDHAKRTYGLSYNLGNLYLDYLLRSNKLEAAIRYAAALSMVARRWNHAELSTYFSIRRAGLLIQAGGIDDAEELLGTYSPPGQNKLRTAGLFHHFRGLLFLKRRELNRAIDELQKAYRIPHRFQALSGMNLGIAWGIEGNYVKAERFLHQAINRFSEVGDSSHLSSAFNNFGILHKQQGRLQEAKENYYKSIHLSSSINHPYVLGAALDNLAMTFAMEGKTAEAIKFRNRSIRVYKRGGKLSGMAASLCNIGLEYAIRGQFRKATSALREALAIKTHLNLKLDTAEVHENLGLTYLFRGHYKKAEQSICLSNELYRESNSSPAVFRTSLYRVLAEILQGKDTDWKPVRYQLSVDLPFEKGLFHYVRGTAGCRLWKDDPARIMKDFHEAEILFRKSPSLYWLAKVYQEKALCYINTGQFHKAILNLQAAKDIFLRLQARYELKAFGDETLMKKIPANYLEQLSEKLPYQVLLMLKDVLKEHELTRMIEKLLEATLELTGMERGVLILEGDSPRIFKSIAIDDAAIREICEISRSSVETSLQISEPFLCLDVNSDPVIKNRPSIVANRITSVACLPLLADKTLVGYLYLDSREGVESLTALDSVLLEIFSSIAALALQTGKVLEEAVEENLDLRESIGLSETHPEIVANSPQMLSVLKTAHRLIDTNIPVLITGETGTGKESIARLLHFEGKRKNAPFVAINGSALPESLLESELFGHEKGAFTGATAQKKGLFEEAGNGTLFIDEIGDMPVSMQVKLLRVLEEGEFRRIGGNQILRSNARVVVATHRNLGQLVTEKRFRDDLFYRIRGAQIHVPSLRERTSDIVPLATFFMKNAALSSRKKIRGFAPESIDLLKRYHWPGNVRELRNEIERIVALSDHQWILPSDFDEQILKGRRDEQSDEEDGETLREIEKECILQRLRREQWNIKSTAKSLGLSRSGLYSKMRLYGITLPSKAR